MEYYMNMIIDALAEAIKWLFAGPIAGFLPTLLGTFIGFILGGVRNQRTERKIFYSLVNFAFIEVNESMKYIEKHSDLIKSGDHHSLVKTPKEFIQNNIINFPAAVDTITSNSRLIHFANTTLWANLLNRINGARILWTSLKNSDYPQFNNLLNSFTNLCAMYNEVNWCLYCIARNQLVKYTPELYKELVDHVKSNIDKPLQLERISLDI